MPWLTRLRLLFAITFFIQAASGGPFFDLNDLDRSVRPADDFFTFVNGRWLNETKIPPSETEWGSIYTMSFNTFRQLKGILDELTNNGTSEAPHPVDSVQRKLADLYLAVLDERAIEAANIQPLKETLLELEGVQTYQELILFVSHWYMETNVGTLFRFEVYSDERNTSVYMPIWRQTGLVLPERDYYFRNDPFSKNIRLNYIHYIDRLLNLTNHVLNKTTDLVDAEDVLTLETQLAVSHRTPYELRDPVKNYNKRTVLELDVMMPNLGWPRLLKILQIPNDTINVAQLDYYQSLDKLLVSQSLQIWKNKIRFTILHEMSFYLNEDFVKARFEMFERLLYGRRQNKPRWMKLIDDVNDNAGDLFGQVYIYRYFPMEAKQRTLALSEHLRQVYRMRLLRNEWMSDVTKEKALRKLNKMYKKIGFPSEWKSYQSIRINRLSYYESMVSIFKYSYQKKISDLHRLVDRYEWEIPVQTVNAFYNPMWNEILFPAAILQPPFFLYEADDAVNYGALGSFIGHEMTHGFDDQGRQYDENGQLAQWWTPEDANAFNTRTRLIVEQFNDYRIYDTNVNGLLTLGENIADLGGLEIAYEAFLQTEQAKMGVLIDGLTPNQRFFLSYARVSRIAMTPERVLALIRIDTHAPAMYRVNGPLSNMMGFYQTFNVTENDRLFREPSKRVLIW